MDREKMLEAMRRRKQDIERLEKILEARIEEIENSKNKEKAINNDEFKSNIPVSELKINDVLSKTSKIEPEKIINEIKKEKVKEHKTLDLEPKINDVLSKTSKIEPEKIINEIKKEKVKEHKALDLEPKINDVLSKTSKIEPEKIINKLGEKENATVKAVDLNEFKDDILFDENKKDNIFSRISIKMKENAINRRQEKENAKKNKKVDPKKQKQIELKRIEKENIRKQKEERRRKKDENRKAKLKQKIEEENKFKKQKEEKTIEYIKEREERNKKIENEKKQAKKERKEKALLIKKAQEESKEKARKERKPLDEKVKDWYHNLSFVKDKENRRELQRQTLMIDFEGEDAIRSEEKVMYKYVAKSSETGKVETGFFAAYSKLDVHSFLIAEGYEVYEITPQKSYGSKFKLFKTKFKASELDFFLTQLSTFLKAGITLVESVKILSKQTKKKDQKNIYKSIIYELTMGENFSEALNKQGDAFPRLLINMIKASELTGDLPETLDDMASYYRETEKVRKQMISAITYPAFLLVFAIVILMFMMISVIPQFVGIYESLDSELPGITVAIIKMSNFLSANWIKVILVAFVVIAVFVVMFKTIKVFKSLVQTILMNVPIIGNIIIYNEVTMFTKTFASLLNHNVYITDCMEVLSKITNNEVYKMMIFDTIANLARGEAISNSFKNHWAFPTIAYEMILTGEKTGQLGDMMQKVSDYYQEQHRNAVNQIKAFIEPIMIILIAAIVGVILMSVVLPMFDMYETLSAE